ERKENALFSAEAIEAIYKISEGIPRLVNTLCENCLMLGFGLQLKHITPAIVREVVSDLRLEQPAANGESRNRVQGTQVYRDGDNAQATASGFPALSEDLKRRNLYTSPKQEG